MNTYINQAQGMLSTIAARMERSWWSLYGVCVVVAAVIVLLFSSGSTPLYPYLSPDQSIWTVIGRGITEGYVPYRDLYDHKGPLMFFIYGLGYTIADGKWGMYLIEVLTTALIWSVSFRISRLFVDAKASLLVLGIFILWWWGTIDGGATNEIFSLPFVMVPMYGILRHLTRGGDVNGVPSWLFYVIGFCGGAMVMIRMNNAAFLFGMTLALILLRWRQGSILSLLVPILQMAIGLALAILPFILYFYIHGALDYFVLGSFTHSFAYVAHGSAPWSLLDWLLYAIRIASSPLLFALVWCEWRRKTMNTSVALILMSGVVLVCLVHMGGRGYLHYYQTFSPVFLLALCFVFRHYAEAVRQGTMRQRVAIVRALILAAVLFSPYYIHMFNRCVSTAAGVVAQVRGSGLERYRKVSEYFVNLIPPDERDQILALDVQPDIYVYMNVIPCFRYFVFQTNFEKVVPRFNDEMMFYLNNTPPKYIIVERGSRFDAFLGIHYEQLASSPDPEVMNLLLYKRKSEQ